MPTAQGSPTPYRGPGHSRTPRGASGSKGGFTLGQSTPREGCPTAVFPAVGGRVAGPAAWLQITGEADGMGAAGALPFKAGSSVFMAEAQMVPGVREQSEHPRRQGSALGGGEPGTGFPAGRSSPVRWLSDAGSRLPDLCLPCWRHVRGCKTPCKAHALRGCFGIAGSSMPEVPGLPPAQRLRVSLAMPGTPAATPSRGCRSNHRRSETGVSCTRLVSVFAAHAAPRTVSAGSVLHLNLAPQARGGLLALSFNREPPRSPHARAACGGFAGL